MKTLKSPSVVNKYPSSDWRLRKWNEWNSETHELSKCQIIQTTDQYKENGNCVCVKSPAVFLTILYLFLYTIHSLDTINIYRMHIEMVVCMRAGFECACECERMWAYVWVCKLSVKRWQISWIKGDWNHQIGINKFLF